MTAAALKWLPILFSWGLVGLALARYYGERKKAVIVAGGSGFAFGAGIAWLLFRTMPGEVPFVAVKSTVGLGVVLLYVVGVSALYRTLGVTFTAGSFPRLGGTRVAAGGVAFLAGVPMGMLMAGMLPANAAGADSLFPIALLCLSCVAVLAATASSEPYIPVSLKVTRESLFLLVVSTLLFAASFSPRLDLFSPLAMKVMKFIHDFIHQLFESMLIPDHPFFRPDIWNYIGLLFSKEVGFWGGLIIWFGPALFTMLALWMSPLPSVAHVRQGAKRRKLLAMHIRERRLRLIVPWLAVLLLSLAVYQSNHPTVEYWDPKPLPVTPTANGDLFIPKKSGDIDLEDGKIHKFLYRKGESSVRFLVLTKPDGNLTVTLDACSICQPEGYGQTEGNVICYYCKTLIPLETVGKPGGCNPVPLPFTLEAEGIRLSSRELVDTWNTNILTVSKGVGRGK